jgi:hypothetical protein
MLLPGVSVENGPAAAQDHQNQDVALPPVYAEEDAVLLCRNRKHIFMGRTERDMIH